MKYDVLVTSGKERICVLKQMFNHKKDAMEFLNGFRQSYTREPGTVFYLYRNFPNKNCSKCGHVKRKDSIEWWVQFIPDSKNAKVVGKSDTGHDILDAETCKARIMLKKI